MTTATLATGTRTMATVEKPRRSLEELVDRLMAALFSEQPQTAPATETPSVAKSVHEARRLRQAGDVEGALAVLASMDTTKAEPHQARWAYAEWTDLVRRRFGDRDALAARQGRLPAQPAGAEALSEGLPSALTGEWPGAVVLQ